MAGIALAADSTTVVLNGTAIVDLSEGDYIVLTPANPATSHINSTNGGVNINERSDRGVHDLTLRVQRYSASDGILNNLPPAVRPSCYQREPEGKLQSRRNRRRGVLELGAWQRNDSADQHKVRH